MLRKVIIQSLITATYSQLDTHSHLFLGLVLLRSFCQKGMLPLHKGILVDLIKETALLISKGRREPKHKDGKLCKQKQGDRKEGRGGNCGDHIRSMLTCYSDFFLHY